MIFRQLFEPLSSTYSYLFGCEDTGQALLVDPVIPTMDRDLSLLRDLQLELAMTVDTHLHADHITSALHLRQQTGCKIAFPAVDNLPCADIHITDQQPLTLGSIELLPLFTPGHTDDHYSFRVDGKVLTGDCLLIDGCGRTDFQNGDSATLYRTINEILFALPDDTLVYPAHDYQGRHVSSIAQEKARNPRVGGERSEQEFVQLMANLGLPYPKFIDFAVPGNKLCGECPDDLPDKLAEYCEQMTFSPQG